MGSPPSVPEVPIAVHASSTSTGSLWMMAIKLSGAPGLRAGVCRRRAHRRRNRGVGITRLVEVKFWLAWVGHDECERAANGAVLIGC